MPMRYLFIYLIVWHFWNFGTATYNFVFDWVY